LTRIAKVCIENRNFPPTQCISNLIWNTPFIKLLYHLQHLFFGLFVKFGRYKLGKGVPPQYEKNKEQDTEMIAPFRNVVSRVLVLSIIRQIRRKQKTSVWKNR
jgi:hypothetical protein